MARSLETWMTDGTYLPPIMRDFHDQKDIFKAIHETVNVAGHDYAKEVNWIAGQCYVIDIFLWFMAKRGYTLQRSRAPFEFRDIANDIAANRARSAESLRSILTPPAQSDGGSHGEKENG